MAFSSAFSSAFAHEPPVASPEPRSRAGDLRTVYLDLDHGIDWIMDGYDLATDAGLTTAVILSLFTDARARDDDALPPGATDRRGWWGDAYPVVAGDRIGSRLWLLRASKQLPAALVQARTYAREALDWLIEDGVARRLEVEAFIVRFEVLGLLIRIYRPDGREVPLRFDLLWSAM